jgi:hypothetical protein
MQVDNQLYNARFPILIYPVFKVPPSLSVLPQCTTTRCVVVYSFSYFITQDLPDVTDKTMVPFLQFTLQRSTATDVDYFHAITFAMQEIEVRHSTLS